MFTRKQVIRSVVSGSENAVIAGLFTAFGVGCGVKLALNNIRAKDYKHAAINIVATPGTALLIGLVAGIAFHNNKKQDADVIELNRIATL